MDDLPAIVLFRMDDYGNTPSGRSCDELYWLEASVTTSNQAALVRVPQNWASDISTHKQVNICYSSHQAYITRYSISNRAQYWEHGHAPLGLQCPSAMCFKIICGAASLLAHGSKMAWNLHV